MSTAEQLANFEDAVMSESIPVNSIAAANRLVELLNEKKTNTVRFASDDWRIRALVWFLMMQLTDEQLGAVNMGDLYSETARLKREEEKAWQSQ